MGRARSFDETTVLAAAGRAFLVAGYEGTSVDELVAETGILRGSIYQAFGSKRGLFLAVLRSLRSGGLSSEALDLTLIATLELAPRDSEVRAVVADLLRDRPDPARLLGDRLLIRGGLADAAEPPATPRREPA